MLRLAALMAAALSAGVGSAFAQTPAEVFALLQQEESAVKRVQHTLERVCSPMHNSQHSVAGLAQQLGLTKIKNPNAGKSMTVAGRKLTPPAEAWVWPDAPSVLVAEEHATPPNAHGCNIVVVGHGSKAVAALVGKFAAQRALAGRPISDRGTYFQGSASKRPAILTTEYPDSIVISFIGQVGQNGG